MIDPMTIHGSLKNLILGMEYGDFLNSSTDCPFFGFLTITCDTTAKRVSSLGSILSLSLISLMLLGAFKGSNPGVFITSRTFAQHDLTYQLR